MVDFWGLFGSALTLVAGVVGIGIMIWYELRKQGSKFTQTTNQLEKMNQSLKSMTLSQIYEKIAVLKDIPSQISSWQDGQVESNINRIINDLRAIAEVRSILSDQQKEELSVLRANLMNAIEPRANTNRIKATFDVIFSA
jgi:uncharacterized protein HemX